MSHKPAEERRECNRRVSGGAGEASGERREGEEKVDELGRFETSAEKLLGRC